MLISAIGVVLILMWALPAFGAEAPVEISAEQLPDFVHQDTDLHPHAQTLDATIFKDVSPVVPTDAPVRLPADQSIDPPQDPQP